MDEYATFVEASIRQSNPFLAARQKQIEKRIRSPFRIDAIPHTPQPTV